MSNGRRFRCILGVALLVACGGGRNADDDALMTKEDAATADDMATGPDAVSQDVSVADKARPPDEIVPAGCPSSLPEEGLSLPYAGAQTDPTPYPEHEEFLAVLDGAFAQGKLAETPLEVDRESYPMFDFQPEDSPKGRLDWEYNVRHNHFGLLSYMNVFEQQLGNFAGAPVPLLTFLSDKLGAYAELGSVQIFIDRAAELASNPGALECALGALWTGEGAEPPEEFALDDIPPEAHGPLAQFIYTLYFVRLLQREAYGAAEAVVPMDSVLYAHAISRTYAALSDPGGLEEFGDLTDFRQLMRGAQLLATGLDLLVAKAGAWQVPDLVQLNTPLGAMVIAGHEKDVHHGNDGDYLLILDLGGNDFYFDSLASSRPGLPISVVVDLDGDDHYETHGTEAAFGAGYLGYGTLWDLDGNDTYVGRYDSLAAACLGIGILRDGGGDDYYDSIFAAQSTATLGAALLLDEGGDDHYYAFRSAQGYASYRGAALLLDVDGNDIFEAEDDLVIYPAAQNPNINANMSQGAGQGFRNDNAEFTDNYCGGFAILCDLAGDDIYTAGIFAQGVGYWFGVGFLIDSDGDDDYSGVWYNFGAAAHFAGGAHLDRGGNDKYFCLQDQCMGEGRDYSIGFMVNQSGADEYYAKGGRNIGAGDLFGTGLFWDDAGADSYTDDQPWGIGYAFSEVYEETSFTLGVFLDTGGTPDNYNIPDRPCADSSVWTQIGNHNDGEYGNVMALGLDE